jgi:hypothetical protein
MKCFIEIWELKTEEYARSEIYCEEECYFEDQIDKEILMCLSIKSR